jgi:hypothetical protein
MELDLASSANMTFRMGALRLITAFALLLGLSVGARGQDNPAEKKPTTSGKIMALHLRIPQRRCCLRASGSFP